MHLNSLVLSRNQQKIAAFYSNSDLFQELDNKSSMGLWSFIMPFSKVEGPKVYKHFVPIGLKLIFFSLNNALFFPLSYNN